MGDKASDTLVHRDSGTAGIQRPERPCWHGSGAVALPHIVGGKVKSSHCGNIKPKLITWSNNPTSGHTGERAECSLEDICTPTFTATLFRIANTGKKFQCVSRVDGKTKCDIYMQWNI
jgi:hypothetical protein